MQEFYNENDASVIDTAQKAADIAQGMSESICMTEECRFAYLDDLVREMLLYIESDTDISGDLFLEKYAEMTEALRASAVAADAPRETADFLRSFLASGETVALTYFCASFCRNADRLGKAPSVSSFFSGEQESEGARIAYVRNAFSDEAYSIFSKAVRGAKVLYPGNFQSVCEEVYDGHAEYCILPYENSAEGSLSGFRNLIRKYELVPILTCAVQSGSNMTRFALLGRGEGVHESFLSESGAERYVRVRIDNPSGASHIKVQIAASALGMEHAKIESYPVSFDDNRYSSALTFSIGKADIRPFLMYLRLEVPECSEISVYKELSGA